MGESSWHRTGYGVHAAFFKIASVVHSVDYLCSTHFLVANDMWIICNAQMILVLKKLLKTNDPSNLMLSKSP
jgi:hypothetical protein